MKKFLKKVLSISLTAVLLVSCFAIPASAVTKRTNTYYVYQEESYGELSLTSNTLTTLTYCELASAGKIAKSTYYYSYGNIIYSDYVQGGGNYDSTTFYDTSSSNYAEAHAAAVNGYAFISAKSYHKVRVTSYVTWDSAQCDGDTNGYDIPYIVL